MFLEYAWLIPVLPFLAFVTILFLGLKTPEKGGWLAVLLVGAAGVLSIGVFWEVWSQNLPAREVLSFTWFEIPRVGAGSYEVAFGIYVDALTAFMLLVVGILVTLIVLYSIGYMHGEGDARRRYFAEMTLFITGMLGFVVASDYLMAFIFWEIMGLCSYLLIGYWFTKPSAAAAAKKAFLVTRVGDAFFFAGLALLLWQFGTLQFDALFALRPEGDARTWLLIANSLVFLGAVGKSAQFPLHVWLPDAMEGPTTVSALIHAATMVKAGVYLVARSFPLFIQTPELLVVVAVVGGFTALFAASMALVNNDLKRVLAYSTLSQLGYMFLGLGVAGVMWQAKDPAAVAPIALFALSTAVFHLFAHAFFKAGLFLSAGSVGHALHHHANPYDMRLMGGLRKAMPVTAFAMAAGTLSIAGVPFLAGFYSKDLLLENVFHAWHESQNALFLGLWAMGILTAGLTAYYMARLYLMTFEGEYRWPKLKDKFAPAKAAHEDDAHHDEHHAAAEPHEAPPTMTAPLAFLGTVAILGGILVLFLFGGGPEGFVKAGAPTEAILGVAQKAPAFSPVEALLHPFFLWQTWVALAAMATGFALAWTWWRPSAVEQNLKTDAEITGVSAVLQRRYHIDDAYNAVFGRGTVALARMERWVDEKIIDGAVNGVAGFWRGLARVGRRMQTGNAQDYAMVLLGGLVLLILIAIYVPEWPRVVEAVRGTTGILLPGGN